MKSLLFFFSNGRIKRKDWEFAVEENWLIYIKFSGDDKNKKKREDFEHFCSNDTFDNFVTNCNKLINLINLDSFDKK